MLDPTFTLDTEPPQPLRGATLWHRGWQWLDRHAETCAWFSFALQMLVLLSMLGLNSLPRFWGQRISVPVFAGDDYFRPGEQTLSLRYDFSRPEPAKIEGLPATVLKQPYEIERWLRGREVYVVLEPVPDQSLYQPVRWTVERPQSGFYLRGKPSSTFSYNHELRYGIELYSVDETRRLALEGALANGTARAELAIMNNGVAVLLNVQ